jgi:hypothetical protein
MKRTFFTSLAVITLGLSQTINAQITIRESNVVERAVLKPQQFDSLTNIVMQKRPIDYKKYIGYKLFFLPKSKKYTPKYSSDQKERIIDFLFSNDTIQIIKDGKLPMEKITIYKMELDRWGDVKKLTGQSRERYNTILQKYESLDKGATNIYQPKFYHEKTDNTTGDIHGKFGTIPDSVEGRYFTIIDIKGKEPYGTNKNIYQKLEDIELESGRDWQLGLKIILRNELNKDTLYWIVRQARYI